METIKTHNGNIVKIFAKTIEFQAYEQIKHIANFEAYENSKIRIMPDCHAGSGCVIGTTMIIKDKITPNLVGVDIGCGMLTIKLKNTNIDLVELDNVINSKIPNGVNVHTKTQVKFDFDDLKCKNQVDLVKASKSLGTLGGGNHFIEVGKTDTGDLYLVIHSGSRGIGYQVAKYYQKIAWKNVNEMKTVREKLIEKLKTEGREKEIPKELKKIKKPKANKELAYLTGKDYDDYMNDMQIIQTYANLNRKTIANIILKNTDLVEDSSFNTIHNYIDFKRMILRKGAVSSEKNEKLLIPINMLDGSLICVGKGNEDWNFSAPHGAGRLMSRTKAKECLKLSDFEAQMKDVYSTSVLETTIDEAPGAYKPMQEIIDMITDTADVIDVIKPIYNFKAH